MIGSAVALYFNVFVQSFQEIPTGAEVPFQIAQGIARIAFIAIGYLATKRFLAPSGIPQVQTKSATSGR